ncbi:MAG: adenosine deaminase, partial [Deltaproteobacteria bacterium]|nr:adenosine deaminase [Deltaproteobacteria bacterium]
MFLQEMPKGADLHNHVSGAVYAESYIQWAAKGGFCVNLETFALTNPPCDEATTPPVAKALKNEKLYSAIVDALSMRNYFPGQESGHDHFFSAFGEFSAVSGAYKGDMLAEVASRAAAQHVFYLELMTSFQASAVNAIAERVPWSDDLGDSHRKLIRAGLLEQVPKAQAELDETEVRMREVLDCGSEEVDPACSMPIRYLAQVHRQSTREKVFAQSVFAYELAKREPRVVGLNFVAPEDSLVSLADYDVHMGILDYLSGLENPINVALHAGELTLGLVPPRYLRSHIAKAVRKGHARRIGHGVDIAYEENASALLREMAERKVLVEILLTSNAQILQVKGRDHPFPVYMAAGVPVTLATDDEGVERIDLTHEYVRAVLDYDLTYDDVKTLSRNGLEYAFLPGTSLWKTRAPGFEFVEPCENEHPAKG